MILAAVAVGSALMAAAESSPAYQFLNIASSTTSYGLGGVNVSTVDDNINNVDMNPALLGPEMNRTMAVNYMHYIGGSNFAGARWAMAAGERSAWSLALQYFGYGSMQETDVTGSVIGNFSPKDLAVSASYSRDINDRWRGGATLKFLYSTYESYSAIALAADLGVNYFDPDRDVSFSVVAANLGGQVKRFAESYDRLPIDVRMGFTKGFGALQATITAWNLTKWHLPYYDAGDGTTNAQPELKDKFASNLFRHLIFAVQWVPSERFHLGLAYNYKTHTDMATYSRNFLSGFSLEMGLNVRRFGVGVALAQPHSGATTFMLNLQMSFSDLVQ